MAELSTPRVVLIALAAGALTYFAVGAWRGAEAQAPPAGARVEQLPESQVDAVLRDSGVLQGPPPEVRSGAIGNLGVPPSGAVQFPDGTWLPAPNGVRNPPPFPGLIGDGYAPVIRVHREPTSGIEWFIHADGQVSSVQMMEHRDGQTGAVTMEPGWVVGRPTRALPVRD